MGFKKMVCNLISNTPNPGKTGVWCITKESDPWCGDQLPLCEQLALAVHVIVALPGVAATTVKSGVVAEIALQAWAV